MLQVLLTRNWRKEEYTIGRIYVNGKQLCNSCEDTDRHLYQGQPLSEILKIKVKGKTAIPTGTYRLRIVESPKFKRELIEIVDVPGFLNIRIHAGNDINDTDGCVLPGENKAPGKVLNSRKYEDQLTAMVKADPESYITII